MRMLCNGFTILESLVSMVIVGILMTSGFVALSQINDYAYTHRLYSCATAIVQDRIDRSLAAGPFNPDDNEIPTELTVGSTVVSNLSIYTDPDDLVLSTTAQPVVTGTLTTTVSKTTLPISSGTNTTVPLQHTRVILLYGYRNKPYRVEMTCLRSSDS